MKNVQKLTYEEIFRKRPTLEKLKALPHIPIYVLVENIRSMHNVGSIFRSSDGARLEHLYLCGYTARPPRKEIDKTALGATDSVPWSYKQEPMEIIRSLKKQNVKIVVVEHTSQSISYTDAHYDFPLCLVMGNEVDGVSQEIINEADAAIELPMFGLKQSLNVSVAYGIALYHVLSKYLENNSVIY